VSADVHARYEQALRELDFQRDPDQQAVIEQLEALRTRLVQVPAVRPSRLPRWLRARAAARTSVRGLYLWGGVGRGKTWMMDLFFDSLPFEARRRRHFHRFMQEVHAGLRRLQQRRDPLQRVAAELAADTQVLCFDELFVSDIADAMILGGLFAALLARGVTLVATSNVPPGDLYRDGLQRARFLPTIELLESHCEIVHVSGATDYRLRQLTRAGVWLPAGDPQTVQRLARLFAELQSTGSATAASSPGRVDGHSSIEIEGRRIPVVRAGESVVWFEFAALCGGPRSQTDYIEIARDYHTVMLSQVPVLDASRDDEARRLIALVDELYDRSVNLVVSAFSSPAGVYRGERLRGLFARTVSRLEEMQSTQYLAREHRP
jgi:cell division protein ZapE